MTAPSRVAAFLAALASVAGPARADDLLGSLRELAPGAVLGTRVVGDELASLAQWPWQVAVYHASGGAAGSRMMFECGGTLIAERWVLSAAPCFEDRDPSHYRIAEGSDLMSYDLAERRTAAHVLAVARLAVNPGYSPARFEDDIALLELKAPATSTPVALAGRPIPRLEEAGTTTTVTGLGLHAMGQARAGQGRPPDRGGRHADRPARDPEPVLDAEPEAGRSTAGGPRGLPPRLRRKRQDHRRAHALRRRARGAAERGAGAGLDMPASPKTVPAGQAAGVFVRALGDALKRQLVVKEGGRVRARWSIAVQPYTVE